MQAELQGFKLEGGFWSGKSVRRDLMDILVCPVCKSDLELKVTREAQEIEEGELVCTKCSNRYPIEDGIPNLLPPDLR